MKALNPISKFAATLSLIALAGWSPILSAPEEAPNAEAKPAEAAKPAEPKSLVKKPPAPTETTDGFYKLVQLVNMPTGNPLPEKMLEVTFLHRFRSDMTDGDQTKLTNLGGIYNGADIGFTFAYGLSKRLITGLTLTSMNNIFEVYGQYSLLQEFEVDEFEETTRKAPFSLALRAGLAGRFADDPVNGGLADVTPGGNFQVILDKRVFPIWHVYLVPGWVTRDHFTRVQEHEVATMGIGTYLSPYGVDSRYRFSFEYFLPYRGYSDYSGTWAAGFHIDTGKHLFSITVSTSTGMTQDLYAQSNAADEVHLGFNMVRQFSFKGKK